MTYQELINNIRDLGFSDDAEMADFGELVPNAINRAITIINLEIDPILEKYEFEIADTDTGFLYITMSDIDDNFLDFHKTPVRISTGYTEVKNEDGTVTREAKDSYASFADYDIEDSDTIVIDADKHKGTFRIFYKAAHTPFTGTELTETLPLKQRVHHLVPLLAAYYVWLEDEPAKAAQYFNTYEQDVVTFRETSTGNSPRVKVLEGGI